MADYSAIDKILLPWAAKHEQHVRVRNFEKPLRSIIIYYWRGSRHESAGHLWLEGPDRSGRITVCAAAPNWKDARAVTLDQLEATLEDTYQAMIAQPVD